MGTKVLPALDANGDTRAGYPAPIDALRLPPRLT